MSHFESAVKLRSRGSVILLKLKIYYNQELYDFIKSGLEITDTDIITVDKIINLSDISEFYKYGKPKLKYKPYKERLPERFSDFSNDYFAAISAKDIVIHHPYETIDVVVNFLNQAAAHPDVVAIKQTLYRTSSDSPVVKALIRAELSLSVLKGGITLYLVSKLFTASSVKKRLCKATSAVTFNPLVLACFIFFTLFFVEM